VESKESLMKVFLDTAHLETIKKYIPTGLIDGITTNPTHLSKEGSDPVPIIKEICSLLPDGDISVEVTEQQPDKVYQQAQAISRLASNITVKVPCHPDYYPVIRKLVADGISINVTLVFSLLQGAYMAKLGVKYISPFIGRLDDYQEKGAGIELVAQLRQVVDEYSYETEILAASIRSLEHMEQSLLAGADVITVPVEIFQTSMNHALTDQGMARFDADWKKLNVSKFP
jgi:transaldolase